MTKTPPQTQKTAVSDLLLEHIPASALDGFLYRQGLYKKFYQSQKTVSVFLSGCL